MQFTTDPIPVKPWIKRYYENGNRIPKFIIRTLHVLLSKQPGIFTELPDTGAYTCAIKFTIPDYIFDKKGFRMSATNIIVFNTIFEEFVKDRFEYALELKIMWAQRNGVKFKVVDFIADLREKFGIGEDDLPHETIKKSLYRFCKRENIDFEEVKNLENFVPKTRLKSSEEFGIRATLFRRRVGVKKTQFYAWVKKGYIKTVKLGGRTFVEIDSIPDPLKKYLLDYTESKNRQYHKLQVQ